MERTAVKQETSDANSDANSEDHIYLRTTTSSPVQQNRKFNDLWVRLETE